MSRKSQYTSEERGAELTELLDSLDALIERTKVMYEQYFLGILKLAPEQLHRDIDRKVRELTQQQIRNTALRYRFTTLAQKFGSYNTYWRRTLREIEAGRYVRDIARAQRKAERLGEELPEELVAAMPKRMRDRIRRDREMLRKRGERMGGGDDQLGDLLGIDDEAVVHSALPGDAVSAQVRQPRSNVHQLDDDFDQLDDQLDEIFKELTGTPGAAPASQPASSSAPAARAGSRTTSRTTSRIEPLSPPSPAPAQARARARDLDHAQAGHGRARAGSSMAPPPGMTEADMRTLYNHYVQARQQVGDHGQVSYERLTRTLNEQAPRIMKQYRAVGVQYSVVVKDDRVILKAQPKRSE